MARNKHSKKEVEAALSYAESKGWRVEDGGGGHAWGRMYCPYKDVETPCRGGTYCKTSIWSTPKDAGTHAFQLRRVVDNCTVDNTNNQGGGCGAGADVPADADD